eukprot:529311_1
MATRKFREILFCKTGTVPLSIMEYSYCIRDAFIKLLPDIFPYQKHFQRIEKYTVPLAHTTNTLFKCKQSMSLMTLCLRIALFINEPNYSYRTHIQQSLSISITYHYGSSIFGSSKLLIDHICKCIEIYLINSTQYTWTYSELDNANNAEYELYNNNTICQSSDMMINDAICIGISPEINLNYDNMLCFELYCLGKKDEMWIGICNKDKFGEDALGERKLNNRITYYGGRKDSNDKRDFWDGFYGAIHGMKQLMQTHLESYGEGDWLTIIIDTFKQKITFFKNKRFQSAISYKQYRKRNLLNDCVVLYVVVDEIFDGIFIEQVVHFGSVWKKIYTGK